MKTIHSHSLIAVAMMSMGATRIDTGLPYQFKSTCTIDPDETLPGAGSDQKKADGDERDPTSAVSTSTDGVKSEQLQAQTEGDEQPGSGEPPTGQSGGNLDGDDSAAGKPAEEQPNG